MVDEAMALFDDEQERKRREEDAKRNVPDDDGFITVTRKGRKTNNDGAGGSVMAISKEEAEKLKPKKDGLVDFYRFQMRERKRNGKF